MSQPQPSLPARYADARLVAKGGMGEVWRARDTELGRDVAFKLLTAGDGPEPEQTRRARLLREARAMAQLSSHRHVATVYDVGEHEGRPWMAMEWLPGGTLAQRLQAGRVARDEAMQWLTQAAAALDAAHVAGVVHRDVKPGNILFDAGGDVRVADFGIARWSFEQDAALTQPGALIGTASYMSPEQARGEAVEAASDQYSLMLIAYELLTGSRPFPRDSAIAELAAHVSDEPPPPSSQEPTLTAAVDRVLARALAKRPAERYASCAAAVAALAEALDDRDRKTIVMPRGASAPPRVAPAAAAAPGGAPGRANPRASQRWLLPIAALGLLLFAALLLAGLAQRDAPEPSSGAARRDSPEGKTVPGRQQEREPEAEEAAPGAEPEEPAEPVEAPTSPDPSDAIARHERAFALLQQGRYAEALELAQGALRDLSGVEPYEAYANYNVGASLVGLGRCAEALPYLDRSEQLQGQRAEIDAARDEAERCGEEGGRGGGKQKKGKGSGRGRDD